MRHSKDCRDKSAMGNLLARIIYLATVLGFLEFKVETAAAADGAVANATAELPYTNQYSGAYFTADFDEVFRLRHIEGNGQGDVPAYTNFGFTKYVWDTQGVLMFDLGARVTNEADGGFTGGIHRRTIFGQFVVGAGLFADVQEDFGQGSVAIEVFSQNWSFRANSYSVIGTDVETESEFNTTGATNIFFQGNNILADNLELNETHRVAMDGFDIELARNFDWQTSEIFVGGYFLDGDFGQNAVGAKGGVRGFLTRDLAANLTVSSDDLFGTNLYGGFTWFIGTRNGLIRPNMRHRLSIPVERNEQVVVSEVRTVTPVAGPIILTEDDDAIEVVHVAAGAAGANDGTFEDPFSALPATQDSDIVYVHAGSVFVGQSYTVGEGQRFLGEGSGNTHLVDTDQLGDIVLPDGNGGANRPIIQAAPSDAIVLGGSDVEVSNFAIQNAVGNGIFGNGITEFDINRNVISGSGGRGIFLNNVTGEVGELFATGEVSDNVVTSSNLQNIQIVLAGDFKGEVTGNTADLSTTSRGIEISSLFQFKGEINGNSASNNFLDGIAVDVDQFDGEISNNTADDNQGDGIFLTFGTIRGDILGNSASGNGDNGIDFNITGDHFSNVEIAENTANNNGTEGIKLLFAGTGTSRVRVLRNNLSGNNGGIDREFFAENEDVFGNSPNVYIELDGNTSTNALGAGPPFNYEFDNNDLFADGEMTLDLGTNIGSVENDEDVELGKFPH